MKRTTCISFKLAAVLAAATIASAAAPSAHAQLGIYIGRTPPPLRYENRPPMPGDGYNWVDGYWEPYQGRYRWHGGFWQQPPYPNAYWNHPHYDHYPQGWRYHEGGWGHEDHGDHHDDDHRGKDRRDNGHHGDDHRGDDHKGGDHH